MIKAIATTAFVHGPLKLQRGDEAEFSPPTFTALAAQGLVREKADPSPEPVTPATTKPTRAARAPANKKAPDLQTQATAPDAVPVPTDTAATDVTVIPQSSPAADSVANTPDATTDHADNP